MCQRRRLPRARSGNDQEWLVTMIGRRPVFGVEVGQKRIESRFGGRGHP